MPVPLYFNLMDLELACPGCRVPLGVPAAAVGTAVGCPHCGTRFRPAADGSATPLPPPRRLPQRLLIPVVGLLFLGAAGVLVNGAIAARTVGQPENALGVARTAVRQERLLEALAAANRKPDADYAYPAAAAAAGVPASTFTRDHLDEQLAEARAAAVPRVNARFAAVSAVVFAGGLCVLFGRFYPLALLGCLAAAVNLNHMCFAPGLVVGLWGLLMLARDDVRPWFRRDPG